MSSVKSCHIPGYRCYKPKNLAVVRINGKDHYLGKYDSPESKEKYARLIAEHFRGGASASSVPAPNASAGGVDLTVVEVAAACWSQYVQTCHIKNGQPTERQYHIRLAIKSLCDLYGRTPANDFGPKKLKVVREEMIRQRTEERGGVSRIMGRNIVIAIARCGQSKQGLGIRFERQSADQWGATWAFGMKETVAKKEGYEKTQMNGSFVVDAAFPGCPHCGAHGFVRCGCGKLFCWNGESKRNTCPWCGNTGEISGEITSLDGGTDR